MENFFNLRHIDPPCNGLKHPTQWVGFMDPFENKILIDEILANAELIRKKEIELRCRSYFNTK